MLDDLDRDVRNRYFVLNAVRDDRIGTVLEKMSGLGLQHLGTIPRDDAVDEAIFRGESLYELSNTPAVGIIAEMMHKIGVG
ncbi:MAG: hypothetical protein HQ592_12390 [Planctomycetes bacterium]|nr:hypothetical protein [Planctomycetota bacterium]